MVYEAVQEGQSTRQRVALRLLPRDWSTPALADWFRSECALLARLNHAGLARFLGGGTADDGTPYIAMEYVAGESIAVWFRDSEPGPREHVRLVLSVCDALEHAHRHLVLHQDVNPANIIITSDGQAKLLNCGLAKLLSEEPRAGGGLAPVGPPLFTPQYASPEQVREEPVTTATDVYALGVLLYILITGYPPYELGGLSLRQTLRAICQKDPEPPSRVVPAPQRRILGSDFDNILLKALRKDPRERYPSVTALAVDLRAWLDSRPVSTSPGTWRYRADRLVHRHTMAAAAALVIVLSLAGSLSVTAWQAHVARAERGRVEARFRQALQLSGSLLSDLQDSIRTLPGSPAARQLLLGRAAGTMDALAKGAIGSQALWLGLAEGYRSLGRLQESSAGESPEIWASALKSYERAVAFGDQARAAEPRSMDVAAVLIGAYGDLAAARLKMGERYDADRADERQRWLVEQLARDHPDDVGARATVASGYSRLGGYRSASKDLTAAKMRFSRAIAEFKRLAAERLIPAAALRDYARAQQQLGAIILQDGGFDEAERLYRSAQALDTDDAARHPQNLAIHHDIARSMTGLANIARLRGDVAKAESFWTQALTETQAALDGDPKDTRALEGVADMRSSLATLCRTQRRFDESVAHSREALRAQERLVGVVDSSPAGSAAVALAQVYLARALLDSVEARPTLPNAAERLSEADSLLGMALPVAYSATAPLPALRVAFAERERQTARLRRLTPQR